MSLSYRRKHSRKRKATLSLFFLSNGSSQAEDTDDPLWNPECLYTKEATLRTSILKEGMERLISVRSRQTSHGSDIDLPDWILEVKGRSLILRDHEKGGAALALTFIPSPCQCGSFWQWSLIFSAETPGDLCSFLWQNG